MADLTAKRAYQLAQTLSTINECPRTDEATEAMAEDLLEICRSLEEAEWLVHEARFTWKKWQGTAGLIDLLEVRRGPSAVWPPVFPALGPKPPVECDLCNDFGWVSRDRAHEWCTCQAARRLREKMPDFVDQLRNPKRIGAERQQPVPIDRKPLTKEDLERAFRKRQDRTEQAIQEARTTLANPEASCDQLEIARELSGASG